MVFKLNKTSHKAFTLAELMIILLVVSLVMAAFLPVMTRRADRRSTGDIWQYIAAGSPGAADKSIFINEGTLTGVVIGAANLGGDNARLVLNTADATQNHVLFKEGGTTSGRLTLDSSNNTGLGDVTISETSETVIGSGAKASGGNSSAFGNGAQAIAASSTAIGKGANANKAGNISIGGNSSAGDSGSGNGTNAIAVGSTAWAKYNSCTSIGAVTNPAGYTCDNGTTVGYNAGVVSSGTAVGSGSYTIGGSSTAIGYGTAAGSNNISISSSTTSAASSIVLGTAGQKIVIPSNLIIDGAIHLPFGAIGLAGNPNYIYVSDRRLKNVGNEFTDGLDKINKLKTYNFTLKKDKEKTPHVGVMAQDLQKVFPKSVFRGKDGYLKIHYSEMFYAMINSVKQLDKTVKGLTKDLKTLSAQYNIAKIENKVISLMNNNQRDVKRINELETENNRLESHLAKLEKLAKSR